MTPFGNQRTIGSQGRNSDQAAEEQAVKKFGKLRDIYFDKYQTNKHKEKALPFP